MKKLMKLNIYQYILEFYVENRIYHHPILGLINKKEYKMDKIKFKVYWANSKKI